MRADSESTRGRARVIGGISSAYTDDPLKSLKYFLSLDGRGRGEGDKSRNSKMLFSPSPSSPPARAGEFSLFANSYTERQKKKALRPRP